MLTSLNNLYQKRNLSGDFTIICLDKSVSCHKFILEYTSDILNKSIHDDNRISLSYDSKLVVLLLEYLYTETINDYELSAIEIIHLFSLINKTNLDHVSLKLKNYYLGKFINTINSNNWLEMLKNVYNNPVYSELLKLVLDYFENNILVSNSNLDYLLVNDIIYDNDNVLLKLLFKRSLNKLKIANDELINKNDDINKKIKKVIKTKLLEDSDNCDSSYESESDSDSDIYSDSCDETDINSYEDIKQTKKMKKKNLKY